MATLYCDANLTTGANDGSSWANAFQGASAFALAYSRIADGDTVLVAAGDYRNSGYRPNKNFSVVAVAGPFHTTMTITSNPSGGYWFFQKDGSGAAGGLTIDGFSFKRNYSHAFTMFNGSTILVRNCIFSGMNEEALGAYATFANCLVSGCTFSSALFGWKPNAYSCTFIGNTASFGNPDQVANCIFSGNSNNNVAVKGWCRYTFAASVPSGSTGCIIGTDAKTSADGRLVAGSPCIGAGSASYLKTAADIAGKPWLDPPAIGCYEVINSEGGYSGPPISLHPLGGSWRRA